MSHSACSTQAGTAILLDTADNVYCVLREHQAGECPILVDAEGKRCSSPKVLSHVPMGHKVARTSIKENEAVVKYGAVIGYATQAIPAGSHVHLHNLIGTLQRLR